jgi:hypothetical protein
MFETAARSGCFRYWLRRTKGECIVEKDREGSRTRRNLFIHGCSLNDRNKVIKKNRSLARSLARSLSQWVWHVDRARMKRKQDGTVNAPGRERISFNKSFKRITFNKSLRLRLRAVVIEKIF